MYQTNDRVIERKRRQLRRLAARQRLGRRDPALLHRQRRARHILYMGPHPRLLQRQAARRTCSSTAPRPGPTSTATSPTTGRVDIRVKTPCYLSVRIPEWVSPSATRCEVSGADPRNRLQRPIRKRRRRQARRRRDPHLPHLRAHRGGLDRKAPLHRRNQGQRSRPHRPPRQRLPHIPARALPQQQPPSGAPPKRFVSNETLHV